MIQKLIICRHLKNIDTGLGIKYLLTLTCPRTQVLIEEQNKGHVNVNLLKVNLVEMLFHLQNSSENIRGCVIFSFNVPSSF